MVEQESSLLEMVRVKELELKSMCDNASKDAEKLVASAHEKARAVTDEADVRGKAESSRYIEEQQQLLEHELEGMRGKSLKDQEALKESALRRLDDAVRTIVNRVTSTDD